MAPPPPSAPKDALEVRSTLRVPTKGARALFSAALAATLLMSAAPPTPTSAAVLSEASMCLRRDILTLHFMVHSRSFIIEDASAPGCYVSRGLVSDLAGTTMRILPLPGT